jgi:minor extracellular serine protease Vpr
MRKSLLTGVMLAGITAYSWSSSTLLGQEPQEVAAVDASSAESSELWFVELSSAPTSDGTSVTRLESEEAAFHAAASVAGAEYTESRHFRTLWNGLTVRTNAGNLAKLRSLPGVKSVYPVMKIDLAQDQSENEPALVTAIRQTGVDIAQNDLGLSGQGIKVAIMDTGVDYDHPDLGGCFGPGCRVEKGFDLVGNAFNADPTSPSYNPVAVPDPLPDDCNGHGTHVAGIVGANGTIKGVAPEVTFHAYRVFGCEGSTTSDIMLAAMEMVFEGGADILNMSIGAARQWPQYPTAAGADRLVRRGVVVVAAAGNEATQGLYATAAPGVGKDVISVASFDNTHNALPLFRVSPDGLAIGYNSATGAPAPPTSGTMLMARTGTPTSTQDACNAVAPSLGSLTGQVALIRRGTCGFYEKAFNAQRAGAIGVVLYNNAAGRVSPTVAGTPPITIPVVAVSADEGVEINNRIATGTPTTMTWTNQIGSFPSATGGLISSFSSYGMAADLSLKPDIGAPGGSIRSTIPLEQGGFGTISGTSMASPHVAGIVALLMEARPTITTKLVRDWLQNSAHPHLWFGNPGLGFIDNVHRQGAGMVDISQTALANVVISPGKLSLGEMEAGSTSEQLLTIKLAESPFNPGAAKRKVRYTLGYVPALSTGANTFTPSFNTGSASVTFSVPSFNMGGGDKSFIVKATITPPGPNSVARLFGGYITFTPDDGGPILSVPFAGYNGDYQAITAMVPTPNNFPWLAKLAGGTFTNQPSGATYTMQGDDVPQVLLHLDHQARQIEFAIVNVTNGNSAGVGLVEDYMPRNSTTTGFFSFAWDGTTFIEKGQRPRPLPNGTYRIELKLLKALGDKDNPAHFETWSSPNITIARP